MGKYFNFAIVLVLLVGFPLGSYFYMKSGFQYRRTAVEAQGDFGKMPDLNKLVELKGDLPDALRGNMVVVGWLDDTQNQAAETYGVMLDSLYQQFKDSPHLYFTTIANANKEEVEQWSRKHDLPEEDEMLSFLSANKDQLRGSGRDFKLPVQPGMEPVVALVDSSMTIRKYYDLSDRDQTIGLVQLISLIIPLPEKADVILAPRKEL